MRYMLLLLFFVPTADAQCTGLTAGGHGSSSCSIGQGGGCSVICNSGYYAGCSTATGCSCRADETGRPQSTLPAAVQQNFRGVITMTTPGEGKWTFVTVTSNSDKLVEAALALQYKTPPRDFPVAGGLGRVVLSGTAVSVMFDDTRRFVFHLDSHRGTASPQVTTVPVVGIANYQMPSSADITAKLKRPASHEAFASERLLALNCDAAK